MTNETSEDSYYEFNFLISKYINTSWLDDIAGGNLLKDLTDKSRYEIRLSAYLLEFFGLNKKFAYPSANSKMEILLLSGLELQRLTIAIGSIACLPIVNKSIDGMLHRDFHQTLENHNIEYDFITSKHESLEEIQANNNLLSDKNISISNEVVKNGLSVLLSFCNDLHQSFSNRMLLKLPKQWSINKSTPPHLNTQAITPIIPTILKELL